MIGIIVKALLGKAWHTWPLTSSMLRLKRGKEVFRGTGPILYYRHVPEYRRPGSYWLRAVIRSHIKEREHDGPVVKLSMAHLEGVDLKRSKCNKGNWL